MHESADPHNPHTEQPQKDQPKRHPIFHIRLKVLYYYKQFDFAVVRSLVLDLTYTPSKGPTTIHKPKKMREPTQSPAFLSTPIKILYIYYYKSKQI